METKIWLVIIIIFVLFISYLIYSENLFGVQTFITPIYTSYVPTRYCPECGNLSAFQCGKCSNCGFCTTETGFSECVPGDSTGPYFRQDCSFWNYGQPQINTIYVQPVQSSWWPTWWNVNNRNWDVPRHVKRYDRTSRTERKRKPRRK